MVSKCSLHIVQGCIPHLNASSVRWTVPWPTVVSHCWFRKSRRVQSMDQFWMCVLQRIQFVLAEQKMVSLIAYYVSSNNLSCFFLVSTCISLPMRSCSSTSFPGQDTCRARGRGLWHAFACLASLKPMGNRVALVFNGCKPTLFMSCVHK